MPAAKQKRLASCCAGSLKHLAEDMAQIEQDIQALVASDEQLNQPYSVVKSVEGIGKITALELIIASNEFKGIKRAKACACYAGVSPFEHSSGSRIGGRRRVWPLANEPLKSLLHIGAISSVRLSGDLRQYYEGKVSAGKAKMLVLHAIRNKLIERVYTCARYARIHSALRPLESLMKEGIVDWIWVKSRGDGVHRNCWLLAS